MSWLLKKSPAFLGRQSAEGPDLRLVTLRFDDRAALMYSWTPVYSGDEVVGWVASGDFGYSVGAFIAHAYVAERYSQPGTRLR